MSDAFAKVNTWLAELGQPGTPSLALDPDGRLGFQVDRHQPCFLQVDVGDALLHWFLPVCDLPRSSKGRTQTMATCLQLYYLKQQTCGAHLGMSFDERHILLLYARSLELMDRLSFINITGQLVTTNHALRVALDAPAPSTSSDADPFRMLGRLV
ncbi:Type III secretion system chaperone [Sulfidibacter corallicola]|uniref:Type III secretion system chaperone n=1 Tax=Sulfidibacter corallicola TaxID=2818388 RepID=A0A8A4TYR9_SULCO|nr:CesT family type III secretion system chaperone [Sulfidibacter corallicola]QTD54092.1 type III secretion system chaperone [Sulfidibacter corallicola]